jgi:hypothetical protein
MVLFSLYSNLFGVIRSVHSLLFCCRCSLKLEAAGLSIIVALHIEVITAVADHVVAGDIEE